MSFERVLALISVVKQNGFGPFILHRAEIAASRFACLRMTFLDRIDQTNFCERLDRIPCTTTARAQLVRLGDSTGCRVAVNHAAVCVILFNFSG
jgi:hypothetical protein